ncbi:MAG: MlaD family protein [Campylobacterota bacterium]|nr:MlaD family protein [Campylobacterota bacterium]
MSLAVTKRKKSVVVLAWLAPLVAIIISIGMVYEHYTKAGNSIVITFDNIDGLDLRQSHIKYNGIDIGDIKSMKIDETNLDKFIVQANIYTDYNYLIKEGSVFYKVSPEISLNGVKELGNILKGNYIELVPATDDLIELNKKDEQYIFKGFDKKPLDKGFVLTITSHSGDFGVTSAILYKGIKIGEVIEKNLEKHSINYKVLIYEKFKYLISSHTKFFKITPLEIKASLKEFNINIPSVKNLFSSAIGFTTSTMDNKIAKSYILYDSKDDISYSQKTISLISNTKKDFKYIYFNSEKIGKIVDTDFNINTNKTNYTLKIKNRYLDLLNFDPVFYITKEKLSISNINLNSIVSPYKLVLKIDKEYETNIKYNYKVVDIEKEASPYSFTLKANGISKTDFIFYKGVQVGEVEKVSIKKDKNIVYANIKDEFKHLINDSTVFYKQTSVSSNISTDGIKLEVSSIKEMVMGGLTFITPNGKDSLTYKEFIFYEDIDKFLNQDKFFINLELDENINLKKTSQLLYKNISIGNILEIELDGNIKVKLKIDNKYKYLFGENSKIYLKGAKLSFDKIENISSSVLGDNLYLIADKDNGFKSNFLLDSINPDDTYYEEGLRVQLKSSDSKNLTVGSPIYYKGFEVGKITNSDLTIDGKHIIFNLFIKEKYSTLLKESSKFYKAQIVGMDVGVFGAKIELGSVKSMLKGGIYFTNETVKEDTVEIDAQDYHIFNLLEKKEDK